MADFRLRAPSAQIGQLLIFRSSCLSTCKNKIPQSKLRWFSRPGRPDVNHPIRWNSRLVRPLWRTQSPVLARIWHTLSPSALFWQVHPPFWERICDLGQENPIVLLQLFSGVSL